MFFPIFSLDAHLGKENDHDRGVATIQGPGSAGEADLTNEKDRDRMSERDLAQRNARGRDRGIVKGRGRTTATVDDRGRGVVIDTGIEDRGREEDVAGHILESTIERRVGDPNHQTIKS